MSGWWAAHTATTLGEWKCSTITRGVQCVEMGGGSLTLQQSAGAVHDVYDKSFATPTVSKLLYHFSAIHLE